MNSRILRAPIHIDEILGQVSVSYDGQYIASVALVSSESITATAWGALGGVFVAIFNSVIFRILLGISVVLFLYKRLYLDPKRRRQALKLKRRKIAEERRREFDM
jgi:membrane-associated protease RseP (regulator of RpoE activity)